MQNALLVGLSRQIALGRELDVVANNIANLNTTGFKADGAVFEEFLSPTARARRLHGRRQRVELRAATARTWHDLSQGPIETHRQSARRRNRRQRLPRGADTARRALHPQRRVADQQQRRARHQRRRPGARRQSARSRSSRTTASIAISQDGTHHRARGHQSDDRIRARQTARWSSFDQAGRNCRRTAAAPSWRRRASRRQADQDVARHAGSDRKIERARRHRNDAHDRSHAQPTPRSPTMLSAAEPICDARRSNKLAEVPN